MKLPLVLVAALASVAIAARPEGQSHLDLSLLFSNDEEGSCHGFTTKETCMKNHCAWCVCAAVPSSCYSPEEADQLPPLSSNATKGSSFSPGTLRRSRRRLWSLTASSKPGRVFTARATTPHPERAPSRYLRGECALCGRSQ
ncbi:hypothetical protein GN244_ATG09696 [Phytophthora infestans]|uniref:Uncharacterized protein n=1 Tax=Phytophthora infestans TaxID=4787 RepID=A0A833SAH1_PHYIN|nr:hypothetical protein GN244_ATG09696 [Phytophthora infestans]